MDIFYFFRFLLFGTLAHGIAIVAFDHRRTWVFFFSALGFRYFLFLPLVRCPFFFFSLPQSRRASFHGPRFPWPSPPVIIVTGIFSRHISPFRIGHPPGDAGCPMRGCGPQAGMECGSQLHFVPCLGSHDNKVYQILLSPTRCPMRKEAQAKRRQLHERVSFTFLWFYKKLATMMEKEATRARFSVLVGCKICSIIDFGGS